MQNLETEISKMKELLLSNIVMLGEIPSNAGTWQDDNQVDETNYSVRAGFFADRLSSIGIDECTTDPDGNPIGFIKGSDPSKAPILVCAELDSLYSGISDIHYSVSGEHITGPGLLDNALGAACVMSLPEILNKLGINLKSTIMLSGIAGTMRDLESIGLVDKFLEKLPSRPRSAIIVKGGELGRLNYFSEAVIRVDIICERKTGFHSEQQNMIIIANELIERLLEFELPQKPETTITVGMIRAGYKYGTPAAVAHIGIELRSKSNTALASVVLKLRSLIDNIKYERRVDINHRIVASLGAESLGWSNPLTQAAVEVLKALNIEPDVYPSVSELFYFLRRGIPAITLGTALGNDNEEEIPCANIKSIYKGMAQLIGTLVLLDEGGSYV